MDPSKRCSFHNPDASTRNGFGDFERSSTSKKKFMSYSTRALLRFIFSIIQYHCLVTRTANDIFEKTTPVTGKNELTMS